VSPPLSTDKLPCKVQDPPQWQQWAVDEEKKAFADIKKRLGVSEMKQKLSR